MMETKTVEIAIMMKMFSTALVQSKLYTRSDEVDAELK